MNKNMKNMDIFVEGMHCASCEVLIEKKLLKEDGIKAVDASLKQGKVTLVMDKNKQLDLSQLNSKFKDDGYIFSNKKPKHLYQPLFSVNKKGALVVNKARMQSLSKAFIVFVILLLTFFIFEKLQLGKYVSVNESSSLFAFALLGLVAGFSSCAALIGGLLLSMSKNWHETYIDAHTASQKAQPHIMFHTGRILGFILLGGILGALGGAVSLENPMINAMLIFVVSAIMVIMALQMLEVEWAKNFKFTAPKGLLRYAADETSFKGKYLPFVSGALTFFLPCGFTLVAQGLALTSGSFLNGALIMLAFVIGTLPSLALISISSLRYTSKPHLTAKFNMIAGMIILFFAAYNINGQLNVLGLPSLNDIDLNSSQQEQVPITTNNGEFQVINLTAQDFDYILTSSNTITAGVPTKLIVDNKGIAGCGAFLSARGLLNNAVRLKMGINEFDAGSPKPGTYKITCTMGMVPPVTIKVI